MSTDDSGQETRLASVRTDARRRSLATLVGVLLGLGLSTVHWLGLVAGGALTALPQQSVRRGVAAGLGFGLLAWAVFLGELWVGGVASLYLQMGQVAVVTVAVAVACGLLGGLVRGLV